jgi:glutamate 5-kinase
VATLSQAKRIVIKIGSALLVDRETGDLRADWLRALADDVAWLRGQGADVILVSSGSIALGRGALGLPMSDLTLEQSQAAAAVGQIELARAYAEALAGHGLRAAQVLVTLEDSTDRRRYLNSRATLEQLLQLGAVPIVNENDTVATDEIRYGDNGFYSANPAQDPNARRFDVIEAITPEIEAMAGDAESGLSKGGMKTKLMAGRTATAAGCDMAITEGSILNPVRALDRGAPATWFRAQGDPQQKRKAWIAAMKPRGRVVVDAGAAKALLHGSSLLPAGVSAIEGRFKRGDPLEIADQADRVLAQGLTRYDAGDAAKIRGCRSEEIEAVLGYPGRGPLIHRDDMAM